ncbi:MAG: PAS domain S-box protein [Kofleriaceae bacterium]
MTLERDHGDLHAHVPGARASRADREPPPADRRRPRGSAPSAAVSYASLFEHAPIGYCAIDAAGVIVAANLAAATTLGAPQRELPSHRFVDLLFEDDHERFLTLCEEARRLRRPSSEDLRVRHPASPICWISVTAAAAPGDGAAAVLLTLCDVTERRTADVKRANEHRMLELVAQGGELDHVLYNLVLVYESLLPGMRGSVLLLDASGRRLHHACAPRLPPSYRDAVNGTEIGPSVGSCGTAVYTQQPALVSDIARDPRWRGFQDLALNHGLRACWSVPIHGSAGRVLGAFAFYHDVPRVAGSSDVAVLKRAAHLAGLAIERQLVENALRERERELDDAEEVAHLGHWSWDVANNRVTWSAEVRRIWQRDPEEFGCDYPTLLARTIHPEDLPRVLAVSAAVQGGPIPSPLEARVIRPDGTERVVWVIAGKRILDASGGLRITGIVQDITERKQAERERAELHARLVQSQKLESIGRLAGGVAHDFNNSLGVILGHVQLALRNLDPEEPLHADLLEIHRSAVRSADLTRQLLACARKQTVVPKVLDTVVAIEGVVSLLRRVIGENITLSWVPARDTWPVKMDPSQLDQLLTNLCINARDAIGDVGVIFVETSNCTIDAAYCESRPSAAPGDYVRLEVGDTGCGMDAATLGQVFEPFFTTKGVGEGTGLGLATVYGAVVQNGGFIEVSSELGRGTVFQVHLPRHVGAGAAAAPSPRSSSTRAADAALRQKRILLVEDEPGILKFTKKRLEARGYAVVSASNPRQALSVLDEGVGELDLLLTDVIMPEMNGQALAHLMVERFPNIKCVFMSGYPANVIANQGVVNANVSFLEKPFSIEELMAAVEGALA